MCVQKIRFGYSRKDVTPDFPIALTGYGDDDRRISEDILMPIFADCLTFTDNEDHTVILYTADLLYPAQPLLVRVRESVSEKTGVPEDCIMLATTHNHSAPNTYGLDYTGVKDFCELFVERLTEAASEALSDRSPVDIYIGRTQSEKMTFVRHYLMEDGSYAGDNFGNKDLAIQDHACPADEEIQLIRFVRENKQDVILMNWQAHAKACSTATSEFGKAHRKHLSADFVGYLRKHLEAKIGVNVAYFSGAAGNLNPDSRIIEECPSRDPDEYAARLAEFALKGLENMQLVSGTKVQSAQRFVEVSIDHSDDNKIDLAKEIWSLWGKDLALAHATAKEHGFNNAFATRDIIGRYNAEASREVELNAISVGGICFAAVPYEMFCQNGLFVKENSPFAMTVVMSCCNGYHKYFPSKFAFTHGGYEVDSRLYPEGTAEKMAEELVEMLNSQRT